MFFSSIPKLTYNEGKWMSVYKLENSLEGTIINRIVSCTSMFLLWYFFNAHFNDLQKRKKKERRERERARRHQHKKETLLILDFIFVQMYESKARWAIGHKSATVFLSFFWLSD